MNILNIEQANNLCFIKYVLSDNFRVKKIKKLFKYAVNTYAYELNNEIIVKFPKSILSTQKINKEHSVLKFLNGKISTRIPLTYLYDSDFFYSYHKKIQGNIINQDGLNEIPINKQKSFCETIATFIYELNKQTDSIKETIDVGIWDRIAKQDNLQIILDFLLKSKDFNNTEKNILKTSLIDSK